MWTSHPDKAAPLLSVKLDKKCFTSSDVGHLLIVKLDMTGHLPIANLGKIYSLFLANPSYLDLEDHQRRKGMPREGRVITANASQSNRCAENCLS